MPHGAWLLLPMAVLAFAFPYGRNLNYGLLSTFITPLVLLLIDFGARVDGRVALDRLLDTAIGAGDRARRGLPVLAGHLAPARWASTSRPASRRSAATRGWPSAADRSLVGPARRRTYGAMSDIRSELQSTLAEPPPLSRQAAAWWPMIAQLEKTTDDLTEAAARARHPAERPPRARRRPAGGRLRRPGGRAARAPGAARPRRTRRRPLLADVTGDLRGARGIARGPIGA